MAFTIYITWWGVWHQVQTKTSPLIEHTSRVSSPKWGLQPFWFFHSWWPLSMPRVSYLVLNICTKFRSLYSGRRWVRTGLPMWQHYIKWLPERIWQCAAKWESEVLLWPLQNRGGLEPTARQMLLVLHRRRAPNHHCTSFCSSHRYWAQNYYLLWVAWNWVKKIVFSCLLWVNKTQINYPISCNP